jgi:hypothetical protein
MPYEVIAFTAASLFGRSHAGTAQIATLDGPTVTSRNELGDEQVKVVAATAHQSWNPPRRSGWIMRVRPYPSPTYSAPSSGRSPSRCHLPIQQVR